LPASAWVVATVSRWRWNVPSRNRLPTSRLQSAFSPLQSAPQYATALQQRDAGALHEAYVFSSSAVA
jgi:hypothetical protein